MYSRSLQVPKTSFFLFGPRGTGKSSWVGQQMPEAVVIDLLESDTHLRLQAAPERLEGMVPPNHRGWIVIDEVQRVPQLLDEVHRLIEKRKWRFALTGSSARKLRRSSANLLAGRARTHEMLPLTADELGDDFDLRHAVRFGGLPTVWVEDDPADYLKGYVHTYLQHEVQQEGITRNIGAFARFLEAASFSQASILNIASVARECGVERKTVESWFQALEDLLLAVRLPMFQRRAKRVVTKHPKFFLFDAGVYRALRPRGPLDSEAEIDGPALETVVLNELRAANAYLKLGYELSSWRTQQGEEVDFVLYGERGLHAIEVKRTATLRSDDLTGLAAFGEDYAPAKRWLLYGGTKRVLLDGVQCVPIAEGLRELVAAI
ncbi:MAG: AAA family ATPase [Planctomycetota bacterium]